MKPQNPDIFKDVRNETEENIRKFIDATGGPRFVNDAGMTLLHFAAEYAGNARLIKLFHKWGADVNAKVCGVSPLHSAVMIGVTDAVEALLDCGADVNIRGIGGLTPLHAACKENSSLEIVKILIKNGADHTVKTDINKLGKSFTPLDIARGFSDASLVLFLQNL